jgi:Bacterial Ig domain/RTX calcium-binding nonapeptide repeat (4 copies)
MEISMRDAEAAAQDLDMGQTDASLTVLAQADAPPRAQPGNAPPEAADMCIVTAEDASLSFPVIAEDADGDPLTVVASQPQSGRTEVGPDGTLTFVADQPGLQTFEYSVQDGRGGTDTAGATVFVNPIADELAPPAMARIDPQDLPALARACANGIALDAVTLSGPGVQIQDPAPGQRFQVVGEPGQHVQLQSRDFVNATYLVVDDGLLIVTPDGNMIYVADFVQAAEGENPITLSVYEGPAVSGSALLANLQPIAEQADGSVVARLEPPGAGPDHGGGAGFSPYDPGNIGTGPDALGPLLPTALGLRIPPVTFESGVTGAGDDLGNQPPTLTVTPGQIVPVGEITVTPEFTSGRQVAQLTEGQALTPAQINGIDQGNFTLGPSADARITFVDELAQFQNSLGVYLIDPDGTIHDARMVFPQIEHADADPSQAVVRPGGGPLQPGDAVLLSDLYNPADLQEGGQFGLFYVAEGWTLNGARLNGDLEFLSNGQPATIDGPAPQLFSTVNGQTFEIAGNIYHSADPTPGDGLANPLSDGGRVQTTSGLEPNVHGLTASFEDFVLLSGRSDDDVNDTTVQVDLLPTQVLNFGFVPNVAPDLEIADPDGGNLSRAVVEIISGQSAVDALAITAPLAGTGITAVEDGSDGRVVLEGDAPISTYESVLRSIVLRAGDTLGEREISVQVEDEQGTPSQAAVFSLDFSDVDLVIGGNGDDPSLRGTSGTDAISGRDGSDQLSGRAGGDLLDGGAGNDLIDGGSGSDLLFGGPGNDVMTGGAGADRFFLLSLPDRGDRILDFNADEGDVLDLSALFDGQANAGNIDDFLQFEPSGANDVAVNADIDGAAPAFEPVQVVTLVDPAGVTTVQETVNSGAVVA